MAFFKFFFLPFFLSAFFFLFLAITFLRSCGLAIMTPFTIQEFTYITIGNIILLNYQAVE